MRRCMQQNLCKIVVFGKFSIRVFLLMLFKNFRTRGIVLKLNSCAMSALHLESFISIYPNGVCCLALRETPQTSNPPSNEDTDNDTGDIQELHRNCWNCRKFCPNRG